MAPDLATCRYQGDLKARACAEFIEMPGVCLTLAQASRLWHAPPETCERVLEQLIAEGMLCRVGVRYLRVDQQRDWM